MLTRRKSGRARHALQVGALPYRVSPDGKIEVLLVTSRGTGRWIIPKGWPMPGKTLQEAAAIEAWEEAGVRGAVSDAELGRFTYDKERFLLRPIPCEVVVYALSVEEELEDWPERSQRRRKWQSVKAASVALRSRDLAQLLRALPARKADPQPPGS
jgi:8-oxo-dGTP pyrophosphatase MutT (NUDIX family)